MNALSLGGTGVPFDTATKSPTSFCTHFSPVHSTSTRSGFQGLPCMSAEARL